MHLTRYCVAYIELLTKTLIMRFPPIVATRSAMTGTRSCRIRRDRRWAGSGQALVAMW